MDVAELLCVWLGFHLGVFPVASTAVDYVMRRNKQWTRLSCETCKEKQVRNESVYVKYRIKQELNNVFLK